MLEWLIIGGGPHGLHIAAALTEKGGVARAALRVLDPNPALLAAWRRRAAAVGMTHLRSPSVHNVDLDAWSLHRFADAGWTSEGTPAFAAPYSRPATALFNAHVEDVVRRRALDELHVRGSAEGMCPQDEGWAVTCADGRVLRARRVVLALGPEGTQRSPEWAAGFRRDPARRVQHVFSPEFDVDTRHHLHRVAVVGGGISALQLANRLASAQRQVWLVSPHKLRRAQFDSSPQWLGPAKMKGFLRESDPARRRRMVDRARRPGTVSRDVEQAFRAHVRSGQAQAVYERVVGAYAVGERIVLGLRSPLEVDAVALATGFEGLPGGALLDALDPEQFPRAGCGTPLVDSSLHWARGLYVAGALAELELGPVARNIAGALRAAGRLVPVAQAISRDLAPRSAVG